jgi:hypothetical protein
MKRKSNRKLYFLIESKRLYTKPKYDIVGKIVEVVISDEKPCILMPKNRVITFNGSLYSLNQKVYKEKRRSKNMEEEYTTPQQRNKASDKAKDNKGYPYKKLHLHKINNKKEKKSK